MPGLHELKLIFLSSPLTYLPLNSLSVFSCIETSTEYFMCHSFISSTNTSGTPEIERWEGTDPRKHRTTWGRSSGEEHKHTANTEEDVCLISFFHFLLPTNKLGDINSGLNWKQRKHNKNHLRGYFDICPHFPSFIVWIFCPTPYYIYAQKLKRFYQVLAKHSISVIWKTGVVK